MNEHSLNDEIRAVAHQVAAIDDEYVADFGGCIARIYLREPEVILALITIDAIVSDGEQVHDEEDSRSVATRMAQTDECVTSAPHQQSP